MKIAFYKGVGQPFNRFVRWWTSGPYSHCEAVFVTGDGLSGPVLCWSSSWMDGGVRRKMMTLNPDHWDIIDVPAFDDARALRWFAEHEGDKYDLLGLLSTSSPIRHSTRRWFCNEAVGAAGAVRDAWRFDPNSFAVFVERLPGSRWVQGGMDAAENRCGTALAPN